MHSLGYVANTMEEAVTDFYPGYPASMTKIGKERGWPPMTRQRFEAQIVNKGTILIGSTDEVAEKILRHGEALGGITRVTFQMDSADLSQEKLLQSIDLMGAHLSSIINKNR